MNRECDIAYDECLDLILSGKDIDSCLQLYPEFREELEPLLRTFLEVAALGNSVPSEAAIATGRERLQRELGGLRTEQVESNGSFLERLFGRPRTWIPATAVLLALAIVIGLWIGFLSDGGEPDTIVVQSPTPIPTEEAPPATEIGPSPTPGASPSPTPDAIPSPSPDTSPLPTPEATESPTPTVSPLPTPDTSPLPTPFVSPSPTPDIAPPPTPIATPTPTPEIEPSPTPIVAPTPTPDITPTPTKPGPTIVASLGFMELRVTDAPAPEISAVYITISNIEVHLNGSQNQNKSDSGEKIDKWETLIVETQTFELLELRGIEKVLGNVELPAGDYSQVRFNIDDVSIIVDGETRDAKLPSNTLKLTGAFTIAEDSKTVVTLDFDAEESVVVNGNGIPHFKPIVKMIVSKPEKVK